MHKVAQDNCWIMNGRMIERHADLRGRHAAGVTNVRARYSSFISQGPITTRQLAGNRDWQMAVKNGLQQSWSRSMEWLKVKCITSIDKRRWVDQLTAAAFRQVTKSKLK